MSTGRDECMEFWVPLVIISLAFLLSLTINIAQCVMKHRRGMKYDRSCIVSYDQQYMETNPIYGNLNQSIIDQTDECCYEPMTTPYERNTQEIQVEPEGPMCYAALNLSPKKREKRRKKNVRPISDQSCEEDNARKNGNILSSSSIYLNSEQLTAEFTTEVDLVHDDPVRIYHLLKKTRNNKAMESDNVV